MYKIVLTHAAQVTAETPLVPIAGARLGRMDLCSRLALQAVAALGVDFDLLGRDQTGICLGAATGSLSADLDFWQSRHATGGPSPTLFAYTLPSAAMGEIAIHYRLRGPHLCLIGPDAILSEAIDFLQREEMDGCICLWCEVVTPALGALIQVAPVARASALFLQRDASAGRILNENDRDTAALCASFCASKSAR